MVSEASIRDAILGATGTPPHSMSAFLRTLKSSGGFSSRILEILGNHAEFKVRDPELPLSDPFSNEIDFKQRWTQSLVIVCELSTAASIVASRLHAACQQIAQAERFSAFRKVSSEFWDKLKNPQPC